MAFSRRTSLNPNADPFLYTTPFLSPPPKQQFPPLPIPIPIFNSLSQYYHPFFKTATVVTTQTQVVGQFPVAPSPAPCHPYPHDHPVYGLYDDVVQQVWTSWPYYGGFGVGNSVGIHGPEVKSDRKCKIIEKWIPLKENTTLQFPEIMPFQFQTTTLMIKNIPNQLRRHHLLNILDEHCKLKNRSFDHKNHSRSEYDFVYLPMDFGKYWYDGKISNLGYAFVNFRSPTAASEFGKAFHQRQWDVVVNQKVAEIKPAKLQGLKALVGAFRNKIFWCQANHYLPVVLEPPSDGCRSYRATPIGKRIARPPPNPIKKCG